MHVRKSAKTDASCYSSHGTIKVPHCPTFITAKENINFQQFTAVKGDVYIIERDGDFDDFVVVASTSREYFAP